MLELREILEKKISVETKKKGFIYFLIRENEIVYVGQTTLSPEARIQAHVYNGKKFDSYTFVECPIEELTFYEASYIVKFSPILNGNMPVNDHYKSLSQLKKLLNVDAWTIRRAIRKQKIIPVYQDYYEVSKIVEGVNSL